MPEQRDRYYQSAVAGISQSAEPITKLITNFKNYPGIETFSVKIANFSIINNNFYYFSTPLRLNNIFNLGKEKRFYPYYQEQRINTLYDISIQLPEGFEKEVINPIGEEISLPNNSGGIDLMPSFEEQRAQDKGAKGKRQWNESVHINIQPSIFNPEQYNEILKIDQKTSSPSIYTILLQR